MDLNLASVKRYLLYIFLIEPISQALKKPCYEGNLLYSFFCFFFKAWRLKQSMTVSDSQVLPVTLAATSTSAVMSTTPATSIVTATASSSSTRNLSNVENIDSDEDEIPSIYRDYGGLLK